MNSRKCDILKLFLLLHFGCIWLVDGISPQIQTNVFKGVPDNWATSIDVDPFVKIGHKYYFIETKKLLSWYEAAHDCRTRNANLASIESAAEYDALNDYLLNRNLRLWIWTSGNDLAKEGEYYWMGTGERIGYVRWAKSQPDNEGGNEHCLHLIVENGQYLLKDWVCAHKTQYICEAKIPTTIALTLW